MTEELQPDAAKGLNVSKLLLILGLTVLLCGEAYFGYRLHNLSNQQEQLKEDYSNINNITFGLFSVDQWRDKVAGIIDHQVRHFSMNPKQKKELQEEVEDIILTLIKKAKALVIKPSKSFFDPLKKIAVEKFAPDEKVKEQVHGFAKSIIAQIDNPTSKVKLSTMAMSKFNQVKHTAYFDSTTTANDSVINKMYSKYHVSSPEEFNSKLTASLDSIRTTTYNYSFCMLGCVVAVLMLWWLLRRRVELHAPLFVMSLLFAFMLLAVGLTASMIEVDARIQSLDFVLLREHVVFKNQVLFFQSKSILDVVEVLVKQPKADSIVVGIMILVFSILFPVMKLSSTGIHLLSSRKLAENKFIKYFAFQSGKWSMADVIVIAILMVYIGLNGLLQSQLQSLNIRSNFLTIITTNNTALQPGYIIFICFVLYGLILSTILKFITPYDSH